MSQDFSGGIAEPFFAKTIRLHCNKNLGMSNAERQFAGCSSDVYHRNLEEDETPFCNQENWQGSVVFLNQEVELMGLQSICDKANGNNQLDVIALVNIAWELIQSQKDKRKKISEQETQVCVNHVHFQRFKRNRKVEEHDTSNYHNILPEHLIQH